MEQTIKINVDCADLDTALEKVKELNAQLEKALELQDKLEGTQGFSIVGQPSHVSEIGIWSVDGLLGTQKVEESLHCKSELQKLREKFTFEKIPDIPDDLPAWCDVNDHE
ncbi:Uncharacterised protein [Acetobacterium wieringae]|uniref:hypothetical protein n=1 Tax=Acetobacterium wieringae TaxID=52694 RepID=UPI001D98CCC8|nr:hypothetical protein [Acetobacterium wieringae]VUZ28522.1 Uncharacterised protein [Acetobacterium wieringae]